MNSNEEIKDLKRQVRVLEKKLKRYQPEPELTSLTWKNHHGQDCEFWDGDNPNPECVELATLCGYFNDEQQFIDDCNNSWSRCRPLKEE